MFRRLNSKINIYDNIVDTLILILSVSFLTLMVVSVFNRYVLRLPIPWSMEILKLLFVWLMFVAGSAGVERDSHVGVKWLESRVSPSQQKALVIADNVMVMCFLLLMLVIGSKMVWFVYTTGQVTSYLRWDYVFWYLAIPVGFALMAIALLIRIFARRGAK